MSKITILRTKVVETVEKINDEATLTAMLVFASNAAGQAPVQIPAKTKKPKPVKAATKLRVVEYTFKDKPMIAVQTDGRPDDDILATLRDFKGVGKIRFYKQAPSNPFGNDLPFWAGPFDGALKAALAAH